MQKNWFGSFVGVVSIAPILFLFGLALSIGLHILIPTTIFNSILLQNVLLGIGVFLVFLGTGISFWAQHVIGKDIHTKSSPVLDELMQGPYKYSRHPASLALGIIYWGLAFAINSVVMALLAILFWSMMTMWFAPREEEFMIKSCGQVYRDYQAKVRMWF